MKLRALIVLGCTLWSVGGWAQTPPTSTPTATVTVTATWTPPTGTPKPFTMRVRVPTAVSALTSMPLRFEFFSTTASAAALTVDTLWCRLFDVSTHTVLWDQGLVSVGSSTYTTVVPASAAVLVRPGFCTLTKTQICSFSSDCPNGETCVLVLSEDHHLICVATAGGSQATLDKILPVLPAGDFPFQ